MTPVLPKPASARELQEVQRAERDGVPFLLYRDGAGEQVLRPLIEDRGPVVVGRHSTTDVPLRWDDAVSRSHAVIERIAREWTVVDDGISRNGTFVNGTRIQGRRRLSDRDVLRFGATVVLFRSPPLSGSAGITRMEDDLIGREELTRMQHKVLVALCRPYRHGGGFATTPATNRQIATELQLSVEAVRTHLRGLFGRFKVEELPQNRKRARLVELAFRSGAVTERDL